MGFIFCLITIHTEYNLEMEVHMSPSYFVYVCVCFCIEGGRGVEYM
jgi:hypothetical protein